MKGLIHTLTLSVLLGTAPLLQAATTPPTADAGTTGNAATTPAAPAVLSQQEMAVEALKQARLKGEKLELNDKGKQVFALFTPARGKMKGGVVLLHDIGGHVDSPGVIHPLRTELPEHGWATLAVMLPPLEDDKLTTGWLDSSQGRIAAALSELRQRGINTIALAGHGLGALAAADYLATGNSPAVKGLIVIGMNGSRNNKEPRLDGAAALAKVKTSILDIYGGHDFNDVLDSAERRASFAQQGDGANATAHKVYNDIAKDYTEEKGDKVGYRQLKIAPAAHDFSRQEASLVRRIRGWLKRYIADK